MGFKFNICPILVLLWTTTYVFSEAPVNKGLVIGGRNVAGTAHAHLVLLVYQSEYICSGSIVTSRWVISAAHCNRNDYLKIYHKYNYAPSANGFGRKLADGQLWLSHPEFPAIFGGEMTYAMSSKDIALMKTQQQIPFDRYVRPIALADRVPWVGVRGVVAGYGLNEDEDAKSPKEGDVEVIACPGPAVKGILCTNGVAYPQPGDSGGPLVIGDLLVGVVSSGCDVCPADVYVSVAAHLSWIKMIVTRY